jgi:hypothetical protein
MKPHPYPFHVYRAPRADDGTSDLAGSGVSGLRGRDLSRNAKQWEQIALFLGNGSSAARGRRAQAKRERRPRAAAGGNA